MSTKAAFQGVDLLSPTRLIGLGRRLQAEREELREQLRDEGNLVADREPGDGMITCEIREMEYERRDALLERLYSVEAALERLWTAEYGVCSSCGQPITWQRIRTDPAVSLCRSCKVAGEGVVETPTL